MRIDWIIACRHVEPGPNPSIAHMMGVGIDTVGVPQFPADVTLQFAVRILATAGELQGQPHNLVGRWYSPSMESCGEELSAQIGGSAQGGADHGNEIGVIFPMKSRQRFDEPGCYTLEISLNGQGKSIPIYLTGPQQ